jgi:hypothetical protein
MIVGEAKDGPRLEPVQLELAAERISVRELISRTVAEQIRVLAEQQKAEAEVVQLALARQYLSAKDVEVQSESGRIRLPSESKQAKTLDTANEVAKAWCGFEAKAFRVLVDGETLETLDEEIALSRTSKIVFLRLLPLVGG